MDKVKFRTDLTALDFEAQRVVIQHQDGSRCEFNWAFIVKNMIPGCTEEGAPYFLDIYQVYTEHNGNHWFYSSDLAYWRVEPLYPPNFLTKLKKVWEYWKAISGYL